MARKRMIDPNMWEDPDFASLSMKSRLLYIGLISNADDEGYLRGHAGSVKRAVFGFDNISTNATQVLIDEIVSKLRSVHVYEVDGETYIHLSNWFKYQKQQKDRIVSSIFPKCSMCYACDKRTLTEVSKLSKLSKLDKVSKLSNENLSSSELTAKLKQQAHTLVGRLK